MVEDKERRRGKEKEGNEIEREREREKVRDVGTSFCLYPIIRQESHVESYEEIMPNVSIEREHTESELT